MSVLLFLVLVSSLFGAVMCKKKKKEEKKPVHSDHAQTIEMDSSIHSCRDILASRKETQSRRKIEDDAQLRTHTFLNCAHYRDNDKNRSNWAEAIWAEAIWAEAIWAEAIWAEAIWAEAIWAEAIWAEAIWAEAIWAEAIWAEAIWAEAIWAEAIWAEAIWAEAIWAEAIWAEAIWAEAIWAEAIWAEAIWAEAIWAVAHVSQSKHFCYSPRQRPSDIATGIADGIIGAVYSIVRCDCGQYSQSGKEICPITIGPEYSD
ncbi:hypothetical protein PRIPAC_73330 [Pristionchus pacificus]|uniref:Uncharacterized protein n=1 Tax=Pristionchus pacificus TaxID=54126 RepID=A0A2A6B4D5_PRIPA|nr:hypothetical protein PRIPAC_73330 [Pristionchus pacificus]|eukprot:PDM60740.1 hypothetical protein PRIPAC_54546 [Pristionchus pacificus]